jgi:hypothetical protein
MPELNQTGSFVASVRRRGRRRGSVAVVVVLDSYETVHKLSISSWSSPQTGDCGLRTGDFPHGNTPLAIDKQSPPELNR